MKPKSNKFNIQNVRELLEKRAAEHPEKNFLLREDAGPGWAYREIDAKVNRIASFLPSYGSWTYREFDAKVNRVANFLASYGIGKGDVVSLLLPNDAEYIFAYFACFKLGAIAGPVNSLLKGEEIKYAVENSDAKLLLVGSEFLLKIRLFFEPSEMNASLDYFAERIEELTGRIKDNLKRHIPEFRKNVYIKTELSTNRHRHLKTLQTLASQFSETKKNKNSSDSLPNLENIVVFDDVWEATLGFSNKAPEVGLDAQDEAIIIYTSGTTGKPKGCLLTHGNLIANARQITEWLGFDENDRLLTMMPLFHMNAVSVTTMTPLYAGASTVVAKKFSASRFWQIISDFKITSFGSVATMLSMLLATYPEGVPENLETSQLRFAMCGSAPVPAEVLRKFEETFKCLVIEGYGLSESTCRSTFNPPNESRRAGSCGQPIGNEMKVFDETDTEVPNGELGEIVLRGENIFKGYFKNVEATKKAFANGWFHTGDIGFRDDDGFFYIADRKSDMIIRGGENIYPREIDELLFSHPAIASAAVIGVADKLYGEEVAAFVVLKDGAQASEEDLINFCKTHLADYKCPKTFHFVEDIPKGPTGKLLKRELARIFSEKRIVKSEK
jgi:long-chain acyl-CoA synthetase